jgi:hypothetical protein
MKDTKKGWCQQAEYLTALTLCQFIVYSIHAVSLATAGFERLSGSWALCTAPY